MNEKCVEKYLTKSLEALQLSYVDLYLIHHPVGLVENEGHLPRDEQGNIKVDMSTDHVAIWKVCLTMYMVDQGFQNFFKHFTPLNKLSFLGPPTTLSLGTEACGLGRKVTCHLPPKMFHNHLKGTRTSG